VVAQFNDALKESVAETSEELMDKFFGGEDFTYAEMIQGLRQGVRELSLFPVLCGSAVNLLGSLMLLDDVVDLLPNPAEGNYHKATRQDGESEEFVVSPGGVPTAFVFKTVSDQYGKYSYIKVLSGVITSDLTLVNSRTGGNEKLGRLYMMKGKKAEEVKELSCGDIGAIGKMERVKTGDTLCDPRKVVSLKELPFAEPCYTVAISPKTRGQEDKVAQGLNRLNEEDPSFYVVNNGETHQMVIYAAGDIQVDVLVAKLKSRFNVEVELKEARVPYREKIRKTVSKQGRHKKQTGGSGQFGDVWVRFEPNMEEEQMVFAEEVFGGSVPRNFFPAVEKGLREACTHGPLAGYPLVNLKAVLYDGSYHPVDSSEIAFKMAAIVAYKAAMPEANPVLLEPIGELKVTVPDNFMGDVIGDLNKRRGRVMGMTPNDSGEQVIEAEVPMAEMMSYAIDLRAMTQSRGAYTFRFVRYEDCPPAAQAKAIEAAKAMAEE
jgi:elongation factor G